MPLAMDVGLQWRGSSEFSDESSVLLLIWFSDWTAMRSGMDLRSQCAGSCWFSEESSVLMLIWLSDWTAMLSALYAERSITAPFSAFPGASKPDLSSP